MNRIKCPSCGLVNFPDAVSCKRCAAELAAPRHAPLAPDEPPAFAAGTAAPERGSLSVCEVCHMPHDESAWRCPHCGGVFERRALPRVRGVAYALIPVLVLLALIAAWRY